MALIDVLTAPAEGFLLSRFGTTELSFLNSVIPEKGGLSFDNDLASKLSTLTGVFPHDQRTLFRFVSLYQEQIPEPISDGFCMQTDSGGRAPLGGTRLIREKLLVQPCCVSFENGYKAAVPRSHRWH